MQLGMIGLGRFGANTTLRLLRAGHECVVQDSQPEVVEHLAAPLGDPAKYRHRMDLPEIVELWQRGSELSTMRHAFGGRAAKAANG